eukprot:2429811-Pleurochrysis_carterae.AAC.1
MAIMDDLTQREFSRRGLHPVDKVEGDVVGGHAVSVEERLEAREERAGRRLRLRRCRHAE